VFYRKLKILLKILLVLEEHLIPSTDLMISLFKVNDNYYKVSVSFGSDIILIYCIID